MDREATPKHDDDVQAAPAQQAAKQDPDGDGVTTRTPGGKDALGKKENLLAPWFDEMVDVANELAPKFKPLGLHFRPEILLATALQEASPKDPQNAVSFDGGLGIMQITPYHGQLDPGVAKAIGWDNSKSVEYNKQHSQWRDAKANLEAGAQTMLSKGVAVRSGVPKIWEQMDETHKWRAVLFAYNAGQVNAIKALKAGGPNGAMISTFTDKSGKKVSHDYTAELKSKMDYVDSHDPFGGAGEGGDTKQDTEDKPAGGGGGGAAAEHHLKKSVGRGGANVAEDVHTVQVRLKERGVDPGAADSQIGPNTIHAIEEFQTTFLPHPDGLISPGKNTEKHLFGESGKVTTGGEKTKKTDPKADDKKADPRNGQQTEDHKNDGGDQEKDHPTYSEVARNFKAGIPGSGFSWHDALWLPSWGRHAKPSDVTNTDMDTVLKNIEKQAAALQKLEDHLGKKIVVHCWLRPPKYNAQINGASNSAHLRGMATDFHVEGMSAEAVRKVVKSHPGLYPGAGENNVTWNHLDLEHKTWFSPR